MKKYILKTIIFIAIVNITYHAKAQSNPKFKNFTVVDSFNEGVAFAAILEYYADKANTDTFYNKVGYIDTVGNWVVKLPFSLTNLYMGCYFRGEPFKNGKALMSISENGFDCNCSATIEVDKKSKIRLVSGKVFDPKYFPVNIP